MRQKGCVLWLVGVFVNGLGGREFFLECNVCMRGARPIKKRDSMMLGIRREFFMRSYVVYEMGLSVNFAVLVRWGKVSNLCRGAAIHKRRIMYIMYSLL